jgi:ureidoacrylate peracid hydrolase
MHMTRPCLLVIDFINDIVHEQGKAPSCAAYVKEHGMIEKTNAMIKLARERSWLILFVKVAFQPGYAEIPANSPVFRAAPTKGAFQLGEWGTEFHANLDYRTGDPIIVKPRISPFYATPLEAFLRAQHIDTLLVSGVSTNNAVQATARDGHDRDYRIIILKDACGAANSTIHDNTLNLLEPLSIVTTVDKVLEHV